MSNQETKIKIAIQKKGRLNEDSIKLLKDCGIVIENGKDQLKATAQNFPLEVLFLRNSDIPQYLEDGVVDIAIIGENLLIEKHFEGKKIATSYPNTVKSFLKEQNINSEIHVISGSVEIAPNIGLADGICDIVSSGSIL